ncbi:MAG: K(+)-transporting ATPase subunit F [Ignavibacteriaceae bacterium]|nr:K(+)-transporting ATPase subunit F [Ignavibacteriaceae bacterium]
MFETISLVISIAVFVYLVNSLFKPEKF